MDYSVERLSESNISGLVHLYNLCFRKKVAGAFLSRKYDTKKLGVSHIGFVALYREIPVSFYAVIPCVVTMDGEDFLAAQSTDTMTHPNHRMKGLFITLARKTYSLARSENIRFIFGFPNQLSLPGFQKLGWQFRSDPMKLFRLRVTTLPYARVVFGSRMLARLYLRIAPWILGSNPRLHAGLFNAGHNGIRHDDGFMAYKKYSKTFFVTIHHAGIWLKIDGSLKIGFMRIGADPELETVIRKLKRLAQLLGCTQVVFITDQRSDLFQSLSRHLTPENAFPVGFLSLSTGCGNFDTMRFEYCDVDIF